MFIQVHPLKDYWSVDPPTVAYINKNNINCLVQVKSDDGKDDVWRIWLIGDQIPITITSDEFLKYNLLGAQ